MIRIGKGRGGLEVDPSKLVGGCALVQGTRGSGKSYLVRVMVEQTIPAGLQTIVLDPEGEFATLREQCDVLLAGPSGDVPCEPRSAKVLARRVAELGVSTVVDMSGLVPEEQAAFVDVFLSAFDRLPKSLERSRLLVLDEAHRFCPESGKGKSRASDAVVLLMSQGRKRGLGAILVTQRLSKLRKDAAAEAANIFICRTSPIDLHRAQDLLGVTTQDREALRSLEAGDLFATGPALSETGVVRFQCRKASTTHPEPGSRYKVTPPPPKKAVQKLLAELADLPPSKEEEEAQSLAAAQKQIRELERDLKKKPTEGIDEVWHRVAIEKAVAKERATWERFCVDIDKGWRRSWIELREALSELAVGVPTHLDDAFMKRVAMADAEPVRRKPMPKSGTIPARRADRPSNGEVPGGKFRSMLVALAQHPSGLTRKQLALMVGMKASGGGFGNYLSKGKQLELWQVGPLIAITGYGIQEAGHFEPLPTGADLVEFWCRHPKVSGKGRDMLRAIVEAGDTGITREDLAAIVDMEARGGGFGNYLSVLRTFNLISTGSPFVAAEELR